ncbi:MAG: hypothetical protein methR_P2662 [Methyloprofundus sp.]|nr:MAG: hypothetical protein methR_P2662 [Methyloprofundus sp.]
MKINTLSYINKATNWTLEPISFEQLTLLVGASGVGKTKILKCILDLKKISKGAALNGVKWSVCFSTRNGNEYKWEGEFENKGFLAEHIFSFESEGTDQDQSKIEKETLFVNGQKIVQRDAEGIEFKGNKTVKLSQTESVVALLKEEDDIKEIHAEFNRIIFDNHVESASLRFSYEEDVDLKLSKYQTLESIRECNESVKMKLYLVYIHQKLEFERIVDSFIDVFPYIEQLKVEPLDNNNGKLPIFLRETPFIQIKEKGVDNWIDETKLSSGMFRSLLHIAELYLCADASIILIDEFENSLGVNCIDELTSSIVSARRNIQFILTSHHPYIINNIDVSHWKLISRQAGSVRAYNADKFDFDKSKHKAFTQLINLDLYVEGANA